MSGQRGSDTAGDSPPVLVLSGGAGDLTPRKLLALYGPHRRGRLPASQRVPWEAYERLLPDAVNGDQTFFTGAEGVERRWVVRAPVLAAPPPVSAYRLGPWGPREGAEPAGAREWRGREHQA